VDLEIRVRPNYSVREIGDVANTTLMSMSTVFDDLYAAVGRSRSHSCAAVPFALHRAKALSVSRGDLHFSSGL